MVCSKCKIEKPLSEYYPDKRNKNGLYGFCKTCKYKYSKSWYDKPGNKRIYNNIKPPGSKCRWPRCKKLSIGWSRTSVWCAQHQLEYGQVIRERNKVRIKELRFIRRFKLKRECLVHYSGNPPRCVCCGEDNFFFLTMDHMQNDGHKHRKENIRVRVISIYLKKHNYPEGFQVLCFNCNCGKSLNNGVCPHKSIFNPLGQCCSECKGNEGGSYKGVWNPICKDYKCMCHKPKTLPSPTSITRNEEMQ